MRNATRTTIAPTGTISILAGVSSGIEPNFMLAYTRDVKETHGDGIYKINVVNPLLVEELKTRGLYSEELISKIATNGGIQDLEEIPQEIKDVFVTSYDLTVDDHLRMQQAFQKHTDNAVSKTINLSQEATEEDISQAYIRAFEMGLKGVTIYRDKSLDSQVLNAVETKAEPSNDKTYTHTKERPDIIDGYTVKLRSGCCDMNATLGFDNQELFEVRLSNSNGGCSAMYKGLGIMASEALRLGGDPKRIAEQLNQITCPACVKNTRVHGKSCPDVLGRVIKHAVEGKESVLDFLNKKSIEKPKKEDKKLGVCGSCGEKAVISAEGCSTCLSCGMSKCG